MKLTTGLIVVLASMVFFYLRIAFLRGRKKRYDREFALKRRRVNGRSKGAVLPQTKGAPPFTVRSWLLVAVSIIFVLLGILMYNKMSILGYDLIANEAILNTYTPFWYIPLAAGVIILAFSITVLKPDVGDD
jgi:hypothetical protein